MRFPRDNPDVVHGIVHLEKADTSFILDFEDELRRLENVAQLGLVGDVVRSAQYSKLEHTFGAYHLVVQGGEAIPAVKGKESKAKLSVMRKAMLAHSFGRLSLTYSMEAALAEAAAVSPGVKRQIVSWVNKVKKFIKCAKCNQIINHQLVCQEPRQLHNWIAGWKILQKASTTDGWDKRWQLTDESLRDLVAMLACRHHAMREILRRIDAFDYVPRDFHYAALGTLVINFQPALSGLGSVEAPEGRYLSLTEDYLVERLYGDERVALLERLVSKLGAALLVSKRISPTPLIRMDDPALRRELNRRRGADLPALDELVRQVIDERWFCVARSEGLSTEAVAEVDSSLGDKLSHPFSTGVILVPPKGRRSQTRPAQATSKLYARTGLSEVATLALARLLSNVASASDGPFAAEDVKGWLRPLSLSVCGAILSPANEMKINLERLSAALRPVTEAVIKELGIEPGKIVDDVIERYCAHHSLDTSDVSVVIAGMPVVVTRNPCVSDMFASRFLLALAGADHPSVEDPLTLVVRAVLEDPDLLPSTLVDAIADALQAPGDEAEDTTRAISAELREYLLEHKDAAHLAWAFPPCEFVGKDGAINRELDGLVLTVSGGNLNLRVMEITTSTSAEKATADIAKAGKLLAAARKTGARVEVMRVGPREIARFRKLR